MTQANNKDTRYIILAAIDFSEPSDLALSEAFRLASKRERSEVHVVHVAGAFGPDYVYMDVIGIGGTMGLVPPSKVADNLREHAEKRLQAFRTAECGSEVPFEKMVVHFLMGPPAETVAQLASDLEADLVVVGTHGRRGAQRFFLGSVAESVVRLSPSPVLVVRPKQAPALDVPKITPPCPRCVDQRRATGGAELWCAQHSERHGRRHTYHIRQLVAGENMPLLVPMNQ